MSRIVQVAFGLAHHPPSFDYDFSFEDLDEDIQNQLPENTAEIIQLFTEEELHLLRWRICWQRMARNKQLPPAEFTRMEKMVWGIRSGRGFGKTLAAANWMGITACTYPSFYAVISPTHDDVRYTCFEGPTGLHSVIPPQLIVEKNLSLPSITLWNGSIIRGFAGDTPERLRGPQHAAIWADEIASWKYPQDAWDNFMFGLRLGDSPQVVWTGTPKPTAFVRNLQEDKNSVVTVGSTYENRDNLTPFYFDNVSKYEGTKIGRQEIHGEVLDPEEEGFVKRSNWQLWPKDRPIPNLEYVVMSLDTAFTERQHNKKHQKNDPTACSVWGIFSIPRKNKPPIKNVLLLDCWEEWLGFPQLIARVKKEMVLTYGDADEPMLKPHVQSKRHRIVHQGRPVDIILIEEKASGQSLMQQLAAENVLTHGYNPGNNDKLTRLHYVSPIFAHERVWALESSIQGRSGTLATWADPLISQVCSYVGEGSIDRDDLLDSTTQALRLIMDKFFGPFTVRDDHAARAEQDARNAAKGINRSNPYDG